MNDKQRELEAAQRMGMFLEMLITQSKLLGVTLAMTKKYEFILIDQATGLTSKYTQEQMNEVYEKVCKKRDI